MVESHNNRDFGLTIECRNQISLQIKKYNHNNRVDRINSISINSICFFSRLYDSPLQ